MDHEFILKSIERDLAVQNSDDLKSEFLRITPTLAKYVQWAASVRDRVLELQANLAMVRKDRWAYYSGHKGSDFPQKLKTVRDIEIYMEADPEYIGAFTELERSQETLRAIERTISALKQHSYSVQGAMEWQKFMSGE